jgi:hypothetical protein
MLGGESADAAKILWCCRGGLNSRPLPYQGSALPLSYGSMPAADEGATMKRPQRRPIIATRPEMAQAGAPGARFLCVRCGRNLAT